MNAASSPSPMAIWSQAETEFQVLAKAGDDIDLGRLATRHAERRTAEQLHTAQPSLSKPL